MTGATVVTMFAVRTDERFVASKIGAALDFYEVTTLGLVGLADFEHEISIDFRDVMNDGLHLIT